MPSELISKPFSTFIRDELFYDVIVEIVVPPAVRDFSIEDGNAAIAAAVESAYATLDATYRALEAAIAALLSPTTATSPVEYVLEPQRPAIAPYLFATLSGAHIEAIAHTQAALIVRISQNEKTTNAKRGPAAVLMRDTVAEPLGSHVRSHPSRAHDVIVHLNVNTNTRADARRMVVTELQIIAKRLDGCVVFDPDSDATHPYVFANMTGYAILAVVDLDRMPVTRPRGIYRIWEDSQLRPAITDTVATVKADAAHISYAAVGKGVVWAVLDSGIDETHPHFAHFSNLTLPAPLAHVDCRRPTASPQALELLDPTPDKVNLALRDVFGHGTHVAGIIAGGLSTSWPLDADAPAPEMRKPFYAVVTDRNEAGVDEPERQPIDDISGMAPRCTLMSLRVLEDNGVGLVSSLLDAIDRIQQWNDYGRNVVIHGVNLSVGYPFEAEWFACGQSPLCMEVDRLVESGVVVVVAAGNAGYGYVQTEGDGSISHGIEMSITDPGNSDLAITVGSTHRTAPHRYGVSYFSSKGPTGDGRSKPDLLAPGERIVSCASAQSRIEMTVVQSGNNPPSVLSPDGYLYKEDSGTSMAAPHVSGAVAAFLSIRREYIGRPRDVKAIFMGAATDLGRDRTYQGAGLVDLMRAIQSV